MTPQEKLKEIKDRLNASMDEYEFPQSTVVWLIARVEQLEKALKTYQCGILNCPHKICIESVKALDTGPKPE